MAFDQSNITDLVVTPSAATAQVRLAWSSTEPAGTTYQVYANERLAWYGTALGCSLPWPTVATHYEVGAVGPGEDLIDYSDSLPAQPPLGEARLAWYGGNYLAGGGGDIASYRVYGETTAGGGLNLSTPLATVPASIGPNSASGFGRGRFGRGGFGSGEVAYTWTSQPVASSGTWTFGVAAVDAAGVEGTMATVAVDLLRPPKPPAPDSLGRRLTYTFDAGTGVPTFHWLASPS